MTLQALAKFAGLTLDLKPLSGNYSIKHLQPRDIPDDEVLQSWYHRIPDPAWCWAYSMLMVFGLRPHEIWHLDTESLERSPVLHIQAGKTGPRTVASVFPEWFELFNIAYGAILGRYSRDSRAFRNHYVSPLQL